MTHRLISRNAVLTVAGILVGVGALIWSTGGSEIEVPGRPAAVNIQLASIPMAEEPMPQIRVTALEPQPAARTGKSGSEIHVPQRPRLMLAELSVDEVREPLPGIVVPALIPPCSSLPRTVRA